ncbi:DNA polymerase III subunit delta [Variovorax sp. PCZ-1]|uniref:DNA polymerase III subunit delta n=1 Tax=Variovorax sp. PCZ-1 TaxID=2835533 RepID=UPI001BD09DCF|nr:DNA polymerase III subunit delta [Variovorax sp. PCZ-1]MBS7806020.1 DNA polymerase III subunit delta [Variovorax sp. PCZ-1]
MQLAAAQLTQHLQKGLKSLYTLHGDEALLIQEAADAIRAVARAQGYTERVVHTVAGAHFDWSEVLASGGSMSLFGDKQIVEVRIPSGKPGKEGSPAIQQIAESAKGNDDVITIFVLPKLDKMSKTGAWFSALDSFGVTLEVQEIDRRALAPWLTQRLAQAGLRVKSGEEGERTLKFFADRVEGNLLAAHQEIQKLSLLHPSSPDAPKELSFEQIEAAVLNVARYDVFKLSEAVLAGNLVRTQRMLDGLQAEGEAEVLVHWALSEDIRNLHRVRSLMDEGKPLPMALQEARVWGIKQRLYERILPRLSPLDSANLLHAAHQVDGIVKGLKSPGWPSNSWVALQQLAGMVCKVAV